MAREAPGNPGFVPPLQVAEEGLEVSGEQPRLLDRTEMATARHRGVSTDVIEPLEPLARRFPLGYEVVPESGECCGHGHAVGGPDPVAVETVVVVVAHRTGDGAGHPVDGQGGQEVVAEARERVA